MTTQSNSRLNNGRTRGKEEKLYKLYKRVVENLKEGVWIGKRENKAFFTLYWSKSAEKISGFKKQNLKRNTILRIVPGLKQISEEIINNPNGRKIRRLNIERFEYYNSKKDNKPLYLNIQSYFLYEENIIVIIFEDITEKTEMEKDIIQQNKKLSALNQIGHTITQTLELDKLLRTALDKIVEVMDCEGGGIYIRKSMESKDLLLKVTNRLSSDFCKRFKKIRLGIGPMGKGLARNEAVILENITKDTKLTRYVAPEGMKLAVSVPIKVKTRLTGALNVASYIYDTFEPWKVELLLTIGNHIGVVIENAMLMDSSKKHERGLRMLSSQIIKTQEEERKRISRELHDEASQALIAAKINLEMVKKSLPSSLEKATTRLVETSSLLVRTLENLRRISYDLRPLMLDDLGLIPTLRWYTESYAKRFGIPINFKITPLDKRLNSEIETAIYRIVQEALTNIAKYAQAKKVNICLEKKGSMLIARVEDDGKGFKLKTSVLGENHSQGSGILGMKERVYSLGGTFHIESKQERGTKLLVEIPLNSRG